MVRLTQKHSIPTETTRKAVYFCSFLFLLFSNNVAMLPLLAIRLQTICRPQKTLLLDQGLLVGLPGCWDIQDIKYI